MVLASACLATAVLEVPGKRLHEPFALFGVSVADASGCRPSLPPRAVFGGVRGTLSELLLGDGTVGWRRGPVSALRRPFFRGLGLAHLPFQWPSLPSRTVSSDGVCFLHVLASTPLYSCGCLSPAIAELHSSQAIELMA